MKNGSTWISRFGNITDYLRQYSGGEWDLDAELDEVEKADNIAYITLPPILNTAQLTAYNRFTTFITSRTRPLLDLSLYVTSQNYHSHTSPSYAQILTFPNQWLLPPALHAAAKARTDHLGLSSLDLDAVEDQRKRDHSAAVAAGHVPRNFIQRPRDTVSSLLGKTSQTSQFKLEALTAEAFEPLEEMLSRKSRRGGEEDEAYFLGREARLPSSVDCCALGYLSLALFPDLQAPWLREALLSKAPKTSAYVERLRSRCFGSDAIVPAHALTPSTQTQTQTQTQREILPWKAPERPSLPKIGSTIFATIADATPILGAFRTNARIGKLARETGSGLSDQDSKILSEYAKNGRMDMWLSIAAAGAGVVALGVYMVSAGLVRISTRGKQEKNEKEETAAEFELDPNQTADFMSALNL